MSRAGLAVPVWIGLSGQTLAALVAAGQQAGMPVTQIGRFRAGAPRVIVRGPDGEEIALDRPGWSHF